MATAGKCPPYFCPPRAERPVIIRTSPARSPDPQLPETTTLRVLENQSLKTFNTFAIDANARYFMSARSDEELRAALGAKEFRGLPRLILGGGSNLLLTRDFAGVVIHIELMGRSILRRDENATYVQACAGENWHQFVLWTLDQGLAGLENLSLVPGTVGACPIQNIGAYGVEMEEVFEELAAIEVASGDERRFDRAACRFAYRDSIFKHEGKDRFVITRVVFRLPHKPPARLEYGELRAELAQMGLSSPTPREVSDAVCNIRRRKLPDPAQIGNAGSFFKNPVVERSVFNRLHAAYPALPHYAAAAGHVKLPAAWLIEQAGWKGKTVGRAGVHEQHALVLVNRGDAQGDEIKALAEAIRQSVQDKFAVQLQAEPIIV
jgi:UDP-N-acetylmuramate dehydrogenase